MVVYLWLSENSNIDYKVKGYLVFSAYTITHGLKIGIRLKAKSFSITTKKGIKRFSEVLPRGNQLYPIFCFTVNAVWDRTRITTP